MADSQKNSLADRDTEQAITALKKGAYLLKYGRRGKPKFCQFRLSTDESALLWYHGKEERQLELRSVSRIIPGQRTTIFQRYPRPEKEYQSFSLIYNDRSLDLICKDKDEAEVWFVGLKALISRSSLRHSKTEGRTESMHSDGSNSKRIYPCIPLEQAETPKVESLPQSRLGKAFSDIIALTAANKVQSQPEHINTSAKKFQAHSEPLVSSHSSPPSIAIDNSSNARSSTTENSRSSTTETSRISLSSAVSSSSHGSYREDFEALGDVLIWGEGVGDGILGGGVHKIGRLSSTTIDALLPKSLDSTTVLDVHNIACGSKHAMLVTKQGEIFSWGEEEGGRLGHGLEEDVPQPKVINSLTGLNIEYVACGENHSCAVTVSGDLYTWGDGTYKSGLLGQGSSSSSIPRKVYGLLDGIHVAHISCGPWHTAVVASTGQLFTFGDGTFGALGHGDRTSISTPREVEKLRGLRTIKAACGVWHTAVVVEVGTGEEETFPLGKVFTWGDGDKGQLGHGDKETRLTPECVAVTDDLSFCQVACGHSLTVALTSSGQVYTMGAKSYGQLGNPLANGFVPTCVQDTIGDYFVEEIACGSNHVAVLTSKAEVYTWGKGAHGQLGHGDCKDRNIPMLVSFLKDKLVKKVFCGANFTAVIHVHKFGSTADSSTCSGCHNPFNFRRRRHNCYNCGLVFCKTCSSRKSMKASLAPVMNKPYRVCDDCFNKLKKVPENGHVGQIAKVQSRNSLNRSNEAAEKDNRNQLSLLSSSDSLNRSEGKSFNSVTKEETKETRLFPNVNGNIDKKSISLKSSSIGANTNLLSSSPPSSKIESRSPTPVSKWSIATLASTLLARPPDESLEESKQKNERLSEEIVTLKAQVQDLTSRYQILEGELDKKDKKLKEANELAANEAGKCKAAKEVIKSLTAQLKEMLEKVSEGNFVSRQGFDDPASPSLEGNIVNKSLDSVAKQESGDPSSPSSKRHIANKSLDSVTKQEIGDPSSPSSKGHIVNKSLDSVAKQEFGDPSSPSSKGHIVHERLDSVARQDISDPSSSSSEGKNVNKRLDFATRQSFGDPNSPSNKDYNVNKRLDSVTNSLPPNGHIINKRLVSVARQSFGNPNSPSSKGHISYKRLDSGARQGFGDHSSPASDGQIVDKRLESVAIQSSNDPNSPSAGHIVNEKLNSVARKSFGDAKSPSLERDNVNAKLNPVTRQSFGDLNSPSAGHIVNEKMNSVSRKGFGDANSPSRERATVNTKSNSLPRQSFGDPNSSSPNGHIVNKRLGPVAEQDLSDPNSHSLKEHNSGKKGSDSVASNSFGDLSSHSSKGHIVNKRLESIARQDSSNPISPSSERNEGRSSSPKSDSTENSRDSSFSNGTKAPNDKAEYVVQDEPGVYITLCNLGDGQNELKRVRFSRKRFTEEQAEKWWVENAVKVCERHNIQTT